MLTVCFIYALKCPKTLEIRYIGKADNIKKRLRCHINRARRGEEGWKNNWIRQLLAEGLEPTIELIEEVPYDKWQEYEIMYIDKYRKLGYNLTNSSDGGEGNLGNKTFLGKKHSEESRLKISKNHAKHWLGKSPSIETRKKISEKSKGNKGFIGNHTQESKLKIKENNRRSKKVLQLNIFGELIAEHNTMSEAAITIVGKPFTAGISKCISGKIKTCYGYKWKLK